MRYNDWDVLLFPTGRDCKTPFKEFRVACQVIPDVESVHCQASVGVPIVTCFVPSLQPGAPFQVSVHSWREPEVSQFTRSYSKHVHLVQFEARVFIDGRELASKVLDKKEEWPHLINSTFEMTKSGELALLRFPVFDSEVLRQSHWNPGDDNGRIKVVISEGFPRDSLTMPIERVKNIVAFSFQHAPLDILEANGIAWPNPSMWRAPSLVNPSLSLPTYQQGDPAQTHAHSPRHTSGLRKPQSLQGFQNHGFQGYQVFPGSSVTIGTGPSHSNAFLSNMGFPAGPPVMPRTDSMDNSAYFDWVNPISAPFAGDFTGKSVWSVPGLNRAANSSSDNNDLMQTDFTPQGAELPNYGEPMHLSGPSLEDDPTPTTNFHTKVPTNTPTTGSIFGQTNSTSASTQFQGNSNAFVNNDFAHSLTNSLLNQPLPVEPQNIPLPASEIKSRKERDSRFLTIHGSNPTSAFSTPQGEQHDIRKFSQPLFNTAPSIFSTAGVTPSNASPSSTTFSSTAASRNASHGDFGSNLINLSSGSVNLSSGSTPLPLRNASTASLNAGVGSSRKRGRNFTPVSSKAFDEEDQPLRPSPHMRASFGAVNDDSD